MHLIIVLNRTFENISFKVKISLRLMHCIIIIIIIINAFSSLKDIVQGYIRHLHNIVLLSLVKPLKKKKEGI